MVVKLDTKEIEKDDMFESGVISYGGKTQIDKFYFDDMV